MSMTGVLNRDRILNSLDEEFTAFGACPTVAN